MKILRFTSIFALALVIAGCGGGGNDVPIATTKVVAAIDWGARARGLRAPSSALSAVISIKSALPGGGDFSFLINREDALAAYSRTYVSSEVVKLGTWRMGVMFYAQKEGLGDVVGVTGATVEIKADGTGIPEIATTGTFTFVFLLSDQKVAIGTDQSLILRCGAKILTDSIGHGSIVLVAVSPGSIIWDVVDGTDKLSFVNGVAHGLNPGTATVTGSVDGISSGPQTVAVESNATP